MSAVSRVSIPTSVKKTIMDIKEIAGNHSDDEIYSTLKECSMDPNETIQKLLFQDTFHEVKKKRDKRKESNREVIDNNWRPGLSQGRVGRIARGNFGSRNASHDFGPGRNMNALRENGVPQNRDKDIAYSHTILETTNTAASPENKPIDYSARSIDFAPNEVTKAEHLSTDIPRFSRLLGEEASTEKYNETSFQNRFLEPITSHGSSPITTSFPVVNSSDSKPLIVPSPDDISPISTGILKQEANAESVVYLDVERDASETRHSFRGKNPTFAKGRVNLLEVEGPQVPDAYQPAPLNTILTTSNSRPSSNYSNRSQHASAPFKAGPIMEWKPKSTNVNSASKSTVICASDTDLLKGYAREAKPRLLSADDSVVSSGISKNVMNLENLYFSDARHVIIPDHLQVSESERSGLSFGSFGANFGLDMGLKVEPEEIECPEEPSESSGELEENVELIPSCRGDESPAAREGNFSDERQPEMLENQPASATDNLPSISQAADFDQSKTEVSIMTEGFQRSIVHTAPPYSNFGFVPQTIGSSFPAFDGADMHPRETTRLPGFLVPQPFDPSTNYYASIYRPTDGDGRFSPFLSSGAATKYNGNITLLPQTGHSPQEGGNSMAFSSALQTQTTVPLQASISSSQHQPVPVFRQPSGVHLSHYPPNYNPYNQYYSPFYVPPPAAIHHFLGNAAIFPQQPSTGSFYPHPMAATGPAHVKYPISQYKSAANSNPTCQATYGINASGYGSVVNGGNSNGGEDISSHFKDNYVFITGQQSEGSPVWISPPGREISSALPAAGSFYNAPPTHAQQVAFAPAQSGHAAAFSGMYHHHHHHHSAPPAAPGSMHHPILQQSQAISCPAELMGPAGIYQPPQRSSQINWVNNF